MKTIIWILFVGLFVIISTNVSFTMCLKSKDISGGEDHTLVLTEAETVFACGANYSFQLGNEDVGDNSDVLIHVDDGEMYTLSDVLEDISGISSGWNHSLSFDKYGFAWSWGDNSVGQLGVAKKIILATEDTEIIENLTTDFTDYTDFNEYSPLAV